MIQAVIFDYGNVIAHVDHSIFLKRIARRSSLPVEELRSLALREQDLLIRYESGAMTSQAFYAAAVETCRLDISETEFREAFEDIFERIQPTIRLIKELKPRYKVSLLSNTNEWHTASQIRTMEAYPLFDTVTLSYEVGAMKPSEKIYRDALQKLQLSADACVYIDDIPEYVDAANRLGFHAIQYTSPEALDQALSVLGVRV